MSPIPLFLKKKNVLKFFSLHQGYEYILWPPQVNFVRETIWSVFDEIESHFMPMLTMLVTYATYTLIMKQNLDGTLPL